MVDNIIPYNTAVEIMQQHENVEARSINEFRQRNEWPKRKEAIQTKLALLEKREVFGKIVRRTNGVKLVGNK